MIVILTGLDKYFIDQIIAKKRAELEDDSNFIDITDAALLPGYFVMNTIFGGDPLAVFRTKEIDSATYKLLFPYMNANNIFVVVEKESTFLKRLVDGGAILKTKDKLDLDRFNTFTASLFAANGITVTNELCEFLGDHVGYFGVDGVTYYDVINAVELLSSLGVVTKESIENNIQKRQDVSLFSLVDGFLCERQIDLLRYLKDNSSVDVCIQLINIFAKKARVILKKNLGVSSYDMGIKPYEVKYAITSFTDENLSDLLSSLVFVREGLRSGSSSSREVFITFLRYSSF